MQALKFVVLVVEDDGWIRTFVKRALEMTDIFEVLTAGSGKEAEEITKKHPEIVGMVIDFVLPDCRGPAVDCRARELLGWEVPVLYITGYNLRDLPEPELTDGKLILEKPFNHRDLNRYIKCALTGILPE